MEVCLMILSGREIVKFAVFVVLVGLAVFYVSANRDSLMDSLLGRLGETPGSTGLEQPGPGDETAIPVTGLSDLALSLITPPEGASRDLFIEFRLEREQARAAQLELLREVLDNASLSQEARDRALSLWLSITEAMGKEVDIENLIRAKGYADAVVILGDGKATILVKAATLTREDVIRIADLAVRVAGLRYEDITVVPRGG